MRTVRITRTMMTETFQAAKDSEIAVADQTAADLVALGNAVYTDVQPELLNAVQERKPSEETGLVYEEPADEATADDEAPKEAPKRPYGNATKADWIHYAIAVDPEKSKEEIIAMSKVQLMQEYGERL